MEEVADIMSFSLKMKNIHLEMNQIGFEDQQVRFDKQRFQQIFLNYLSNAIKFVRGPGNIEALLFFIKAKSEEGQSLKQYFEERVLHYCGEKFN